MYSHAPQDYVCPICAGISKDEANSLIRSSDYIHKSDKVSAIVNSFFIKGNEGHAIVFPNQHFENIFDIDISLLSDINIIAKKVAFAMKKAYKAEGITILQNNEPASNQHAFHYHLHVIPRYNNDSFYGSILDKVSTTTEQRKVYAEKLWESMNEN